MIVNFVTSRDLYSRIFHDIFQRHADYGASDERDVSIVVTERPLANADIYHYHRVHLETELKYPAVVTVHHDLADFDVWIEGDRFYSHYRQADRVICLNKLQLAFLRRLGVSRTVLIPHGYDASLFQKKPLCPYTGGKIRLGMISRRYERRVKGEVLLYELMERLDPDQFIFTLAGEGRGQDAVFAESLGFECTVFEYLPYRLLPQIYESIDFLLMLSSFEGGPANIPEAIASGTPVLCRPVGMAADLIVDGVNGIHLTGTADQDAATLQSISDDQGSLFNRLMDGARHSNGAIPWERCIEMHAELYKEVRAEFPTATAKST